MRKLLFWLSVFLFPLSFLSCGRIEEPFSFAVASDKREYTGDDPRYFQGACEALVSEGPGSFMISCGDIDPPDRVLATLTAYISSDYIGIDAITRKSYRCFKRTIMNVVFIKDLMM